MRYTKLGSSLISEFLVRCLTASSALLIIVVLAALIRGGVQGIDFPLISTDVFLVAGFIVVWCLIPAAISFWIAVVTSRFPVGIIYLVVSLLGCALLYFYLYRIAQTPGSELGSSPLILMAWLAVPLYALYYPLFFCGRARSPLRLTIAGVGILLAASAFISF